LNSFIDKKAPRSFAFEDASLNGAIELIEKKFYTQSIHTKDNRMRKKTRRTKEIS